MSGILAGYKHISFHQFKIGKLIFYGTPRAGKTTLRKQLIRNTEGMLQTSSTPEPSTHIAEIGSPILIERIFAQNEEKKEWRWTVKELDDIAKMLLGSYEQSKCENVQHELPQSNYIDNVSLGPTSTVITGHQHLGKPHIQQTATTSTATSMSETSMQTTKMETIQVTSTSADVADVQNDQSSSKVDIKQLFLNAVRTEQWSEVLIALHSLNNSMLLQVIDGGGQPTFQEIFPLLVSGPSVTLIIFKLTDGLTEPKAVTYKRNDGTECTWQDSYVVKESIFHALSSVCSRINGNPHILLVGTHKDKLEGSEDQKMTTIEKFAESLCGWLQESKPYKYMNIKCINDLIVGINNFESNDILKVKAEIEKLIQYITPKDIPAPFLIFDFVLHSYAKSERLRKVEKIKCQEIALLCGVKEDEFEKVLEFLRDNAGTVLYYADIEELKDYVITDFQLIFDSISIIIIQYFEDNSENGPDLIDKQLLHVKGQLKADVLKEVEGCLNKDELLSLLKHRHIISKMGENVFFMPSVLPKACNKSFNKSDSFLVMFDDGYSPIGLFCAVTTRLIVEQKWNIVKYYDQFRNRISFDYEVSGLTHQIIFSSFSFYYEVHLLPYNKDASKQPGRNVMFAVFRAIKEAFSKVTTDMRYPCPLYGFYCPNDCPCPQYRHPAKHAFDDKAQEKEFTYPQYQHPAKCAFDDNAQEMKCYYTDTPTTLTEEHKAWFLQVCFLTLLNLAVH